MSEEQVTSYAQALLASVTINVIVPLLILAVLLVVIMRLLSLAQRKAEFNIEQMLHDDQGKPSAVRFLSLMAFAISSWYLAVRVLSGKPDPQEYLYYLVAWSGALVFVKFADKWNGSLPFGK